MKDLVHFVKNGRKIIGVGVNFNSMLQARNKPAPKVPTIFMKPTSSYITESQPIIIPQGFSITEGIELGVIIGKDGKRINESSAMDYVGGYCAALDITDNTRLVRFNSKRTGARTYKGNEAKSKGSSWLIPKGFDTACPVSKFIPKDDVKDPHCVNLWCKVNGEMKQSGNTDDLVFSIPQIISFISQYVKLEKNDLLITGSPSVSPIKAGDVVEGGIENLIDFKFCVETEEV